ncbi:MAG: 30S ribosomal protein S20 [Syntrophus sp. PtaU1.Bin005]|uniref:30S ribosomal protein S20 n=1 Tax=Syntrophus TaxID=43773 RepID=UPI0009D22B3A|nr:MAG: 30S ribosomal protein S20 [Syntrophus sp. PtaB.Bin138]OPY82655.1 MAG: 30S ribosomal protein S20 [Syntrophus sp. PtaU1.Bin005]
MATHKSAEKRSKQNEKRRVGNISIKSRVKTYIKSVLTAVEARDKEGALNALQKAVPVIAKAGAKGVYHHKTASRYISRLTRKVNVQFAAEA